MDLRVFQGKKNDWNRPNIQNNIQFLSQKKKETVTIVTASNCQFPASERHCRSVYLLHVLCDIYALWTGFHAPLAGDTVGTLELQRKIL